MIKQKLESEGESMIDAEDYKEPSCPFCTDFYDPKSKETPTLTVPIQRVIEKLDSYFSRNDYEGAERHLLYWLQEAEQGNDRRGELAVRDELLGLYRKIGKRDEAMKSIERCRTLIDALELTESVTAGTVYLNIATVYEAFAMPEKAIEFYTAAEKLYKKYLSADDEKFAGLFNNMALAYTDLGEYGEAEKLYRQAVEIMKNVENGELELAITYINMAHLVERRANDGSVDFDTIDELMCMARICLDGYMPKRDGYYAFVCEKCAPSFGYFGYFIDESEYKKRAKDIYERKE